MISSSDNSLQRLIAAKRTELLDEKRRLGLIEHAENEESDIPTPKLPITSEEHRDATKLCKDEMFAEETKTADASSKELPTRVSPRQLLKYIQRYSGLPPAMLKTGEYSPNNPLLRGADADGHELFPGLGAHEERARRLRRLRQQEYRQFLDQQAKKPPAAKEDPASPRARRPGGARPVQTQTSLRTADSGTQCDRGASGQPASVAVQTDSRQNEEISVQTNIALTRAERELSPRTVQEPPAQKPTADERPIKPNLWTAPDGTAQRWGDARGKRSEEQGFRRRSYDHADTERQSEMQKKSNRDKLMSDLRHTYLPSFLDADVIRQRNLKSEQEAAERRQFYQQELRSQIQEQQRIREERKAREKLLEAAEMRRLEGQLRMLQAAQDTEVGKHNRLSVAINENAVEYDRRRNLLQNGISEERSKPFRSYSQPLNAFKKHSEVKTSQSENYTPKTASKLPFYYKSAYHLNEPDKRFSTNISDKSLFSPNYDLENYLRRNLNPSKHFAYPDRLSYTRSDYVPSFLRKDYKDLIVTDDVSRDSLPIPVLRHSPKETSDRRHERADVENVNVENGIVENVNVENGIVEDVNVENGSSEAMKRVESKWQVPIVQKNIMRNVPSSDGQNRNILTQLGSIRRQLQLEQLKLDKMLGGNTK